MLLDCVELSRLSRLSRHSKEKCSMGAGAAQLPARGLMAGPTELALPDAQPSPDGLQDSMPSAAELAGQALTLQVTKPIMYLEQIINLLLRTGAPCQQLSPTASSGPQLLLSP